MVEESGHSRLSPVSATGDRDREVITWEEAALDLRRPCAIISSRLGSANHHHLTSLHFTGSWNWGGSERDKLWVDDGDAMEFYPLHFCRSRKLRARGDKGLKIAPSILESHTRTSVYNESALEFSLCSAMVCYLYIRFMHQKRPPDNVTSPAYLLTVGSSDQVI